MNILNNQEGGAYSMSHNWKDVLPIDSIQEIIPVSGGDVNQAFRVETNSKPYFLLVQTGRSADFYTGEIAGLEEMAKAGITVPQVIDSGENQGDAYLLLSYLEEGQNGNQRELGRMVAQLHQYHSDDGLYGFDAPYEGADIQFDNSWTDSWLELFVERRMDKLHRLLVDNNKWNQRQSDTYQQVRQIMVDELTRHKSDPSLLHGDLWAGNYMFLSDGSPALFDPASMYGDREFDLGATKVFGGFNSDFYAAYDEAYPLSEGSELRIEFYRLYLLMVHLHKFGATYESSVDQSMSIILNA